MVAGRWEVVSMWENTRMVVLTAMSASLYAAILIPFKVAPVIPGVTEFRPANTIPVVCSVLFGPAAAWGAAIGNMIGDFFGGIGPGDFFGFIGNFLYGYIPYRTLRIFNAGDPIPREPLPRSLPAWAALFASIALGSAACALVVGFGLAFLGFVPFYILANVVFVNNFAVASILGPLLLVALYPRVRQARLHWTDIVTPRNPARLLQWLGLACIVFGIAGGFVTGNLIGVGTREIGLGVGPFVLLVALGAVLI